jgi:UDP-N-acetylglucosamine/UDP-N-acetylgalactosamine 4-epimerase
MMTIDAVKEQLKRKSSRWLVTGAAGFIGSNLVEELLRFNQTVIGLDIGLTSRM